MKRQSVTCRYQVGGFASEGCMPFNARPTVKVRGKPMKLRIVDLFCGPGGMSLGFRMAGFQTVCAVDRDIAAVETLRGNVAEAAVIQQDVSDLDPATLPDFDILIGGPPCIEFSTSKGGRANILDGL